MEAAEGTVAHKVAETWLRGGRKPRELLGTKEWVQVGDGGHHIEITDEMLDYVQQYVDWCSMLPGDHYIEERVDFSEITPIPNQGGTADHVACELHRLTITDLKYGKGVLVKAENNTQAQLYALGVFSAWDWLYDFQEIRIRIAQPRLDNFDEWTITRQQLLEFAEYARDRAHAAWKLNAPRTPSEKACRWCKVRSRCAAVAKLQIDITAAAFEAIGKEVKEEELLQFKDGLFEGELLKPVAVTDLSLEEAAKLYAYHGLFRDWWKELERELYRQALNGVEIPGFKLVESRSRRVFRDEEEAAKRLMRLGIPEDSVWKPQIIGPAQAEKELIKVGHRRKEIPDLIGDLISKPPGKPLLVPVSDKRPPITDVTAVAFEDRETENEEEI